MRINASERQLLLCTAACLLLLFGYFFGTNRVAPGANVSMDTSATVGMEISPSNEQLVIRDSEEQTRLDINLAGKEELVSLPGIGDVLAERILTYRAEHGNFRNVQELTKVNGIGEKTLAKLLEYITVEEPK